MATNINDKSGIRATFDARPDLKKVHILPSGAHYFNEAHATQALAEGEQLVTLEAGSDELKDDEPKDDKKPAK